MATSTFGSGDHPTRWLPALLWGLSFVVATAAPALEWVENPDHPRRPHVEATGLSADVSPGDLSIRVAGAEPASGLPAMAATHARDEEVLRFHPRFPLTPGLRYRATLKAEGNTYTADFTAPPLAPRPPASVTTITPSADTLPLNLLKFYLHFSAPMRRGDSYQHIRLLKDDGAPVEDPFLELPEELWNREMTRLTVLLDPGRIKRGVLPNQTVGAAMTAGEEYTLVIDPAWKDASGQPLAQLFTKHFLATAPDYTQPSLKKWRYEYPSAGSRAPLRITFGEPLDHALATRLLNVLSRSGEPIPGQSTLHDHERRWEFVPDQPWESTPHLLEVDHRLEDLVGNSLQRPFEESLDRHPDAVGTPVPSSHLPFTLRP